MWKCTGGYIIHPNGEVVTCCAFKQRCIASSSIETAYVSLARCIQKVPYLSHISLELGGLHELTVIYENYQACILRATEHSYRNKHLELRYHIYCKDPTSEENILEYGPTTEIIEDMLTKPLVLQKFLQLRKLRTSMASLPFADDYWERSGCRGRLFESWQNVIP